MCIKIDKTICMNFLHSLIGGIFGGIVVAVFYCQKPVKGTLGYWTVITIWIVIIAILGLIIMHYLDHCLHKTEEKASIRSTPKKRKKSKR